MRQRVNLRLEHIERFEPSQATPEVAPDTGPANGGIKGKLRAATAREQAVAGG